MNAESTALLALERQVRADAAAEVSEVETNFGAYLAGIIGAAGAVSATEILSRVDVHAVLTSTLNGAKLGVETAIAAGYVAASQLARAFAQTEFTRLGYTEATTMPELGTNLESMIADVRSGFDTASLDIHNAVRDAYDGVSGTDAAPTRVLTTNAALKRAIRRLQVRVSAASAVAVHQGFTDAQAALYRRFAEAHPEVMFVKRWRVTSADPCATCAALDGVVVAIDAEFDHNATTGTAAPPRVYHDLHGPPRHPSCRCRIDIEIAE